MRSNSTGEPAGSRPRASRKRKLLLSLAVFAAALILCELGLRAWLRLQGRPYSGWRTRESVERAVDATRTFVPVGPNRPEERDGPVLHPYSGSEAWHDTGGVLEYYRDQARDDHFKVLILGGSVAASFARTIEQQLPDLLRGEPALAGREVTIQNYAHAAYKQPQQVTRLVYLLSLGYRPDAVIEIDGFNEVAFGLENGKNGYHPVYPTPPVWGAVAGEFGLDIERQSQIVARMLAIRARARSIADSADRWHFYDSSWLGRWTFARVSALDEEFQREQQLLLVQAPRSARMRRQLEGPDYDPTDQALMDTSVRAWVEGSRSLHDLCASRGIRFVHVLQPTLFDEGAKPMTSIEKALPLPSPQWLLGAREGYPLLRARIPDLRVHGIRFIDASRVFADVQETLYFDGCHFLPRGEHIFFERMAEELRAALVGT